MMMDVLEDVLSNTPHIKLIYAIPTFQNPTGKTWSLERRRKLAELSAKYSVAVIEDNPYGELRFEGEPLPSIKSFDEAGNILCTGSFSKIFCPGFRIGWIAGDKDIIRKYVLVKQGTDLQCNTIAQMTIAEYLKRYDIDKHIAKIVEVYRKRRNVAIESIERCFPDTIKFTRRRRTIYLDRTSCGDFSTRCFSQKSGEKDCFCSGRFFLSEWQQGKYA